MIVFDTPRKLMKNDKKRNRRIQRFTVTAHLGSTKNAEELHEFAALIGLKREWYHARPRIAHYDLFDGKIEQAERHGAREISPRDFIHEVHDGHKRLVAKDRIDKPKKLAGL